MNMHYTHNTIASEMAFSLTSVIHFILKSKRI